MTPEKRGNGNQVIRVAGWEKEKIKGKGEGKRKMGIRAHAQ